MNSTSIPRKSILVAGAAGLAGSQVIREFVKNRYPVKALVRTRDKGQAYNAFQTVEIVEADMSKEDAVVTVLAGVESVLLISSPRPEMVETQCTVIDAAKRAGVRHIVKFSGLSAKDIDSPFIFGNMHAEVEHYLEGSGLNWTHLRPSQFMTEYLREVPTLVENDALFLPLDEVRLAPVDVVDVAKAAFALLTTSGHHQRIYEMSGPESLNMFQVAEQISHATKRSIRYVSVPFETRSNALLAAGIPSFLVSALEVQARERFNRSTESEVHLSTHEMLGITPTTFWEFAHRNAGAFLGNSVYVGMK